MYPYIIHETEDYAPLTVFFHQCGLEVKPGAPRPAGLVKMWRMEDPQTGELLGAVVLEKRDHVYTLASLGVREDRRNNGYGRILQGIVFDEVRSLGAEELWGVAKVPAYYYPLGWEEIAWDTAPKIAIKCDGCKQRGAECRPAILRCSL